MSWTQDKGVAQYMHHYAENSNEGEIDYKRS